MGRSRKFTAEKLDSIQATATKMGINLMKACKVCHKPYGSVLQAAKALGHPVAKMVRQYNVKIESESVTV